MAHHKILHLFTIILYSAINCNMALRDAILGHKWDEANRLLDDPNCNVNDTPLEVCARYARDSKDEHGDYVEDEYVRIMRRILQRPTFKRDSAHDPCSRALWQVCEKLRSVTAAKLLLKQENLDLSMKSESNIFNFIFEREAIFPMPMLHSMMKRLRSSDIDIATHIFSELLGYPKIGDYIC